MKKVINIILVIALMAFMLIGCGAPESKEEKKAGTSVDSTEINVEHWNPDGTTITEMAVSYTEYISANFPDRDCTKPKGDYGKVKAFIKDQLLSGGYSENQLISQEVHAGKVTGENIILRVEGRDTSKQIIVGGHYDGDGIGDNGSAIALMLATARALKDKTPLYTVNYVFFDCEEIGCYGSKQYAKSLTDDEVKKTEYMVNIDSILFGDYCNIYGGNSNLKTGEVVMTEAYELAVKKAEYLGMNVYGKKELDGYFAEHKTGPEIKENTVYTSPWTKENPAPDSDKLDKSLIAYSPSTIPYSDHAYFIERDIPYVYFEATNWFAAGGDKQINYTGYYETYDTSIGDNGMFMNTRFDTLENLLNYFPGRMEAHYETYGKLLSSLILNPADEKAEQSITKENRSERMIFHFFLIYFCFQHSTFLSYTCFN